MIRRAVALAALAVFPTCASRPSERVRPPNVVIVFTDDQGWGDVGCYGATGIATPHLDRMARGGIRFTSFYVAHPMPHVPIFGSYPEVIEEIDQSVGDVLAAIRRLGLDDDTLVVFTSDNGPWLSYGDHAGSSGGLREGKGTTWEGGVRPCIARWPGRIPAGAVCDEPAMTIDVVPTVARLIGAQAPPALDGRDIGALLRGEPGAKSPHDALYFYYRRNHLHAVRAGRWKLVLPHRYRTLAGEPGHGGRPGPYRQVPCGLELYDLRADPAEATDVAAANPSVVRRLERLAARARDDMGDDRPTEEKKR